MPLLGTGYYLRWKYKVLIIEFKWTKIVIQFFIFDFQCKPNNYENPCWTLSRLVLVSLYIDVIMFTFRVYGLHYVRMVLNRVLFYFIFLFSAKETAAVFGNGKSFRNRCRLWIKENSDAAPRIIRRRSPKQNNIIHSDGPRWRIIFRSSKIFYLIAGRGVPNRGFTPVARQR